jgi:hypothetical protein
MCGAVQWSQPAFADGRLHQGHVGAWDDLGQMHFRCEMGGHHHRWRSMSKRYSLSYSAHKGAAINHTREPAQIVLDNVWCKGYLDATSFTLRNMSNFANELKNSLPTVRQAGLGNTIIATTIKRDSAKPQQGRLWLVSHLVLGKSLVRRR